MVTNTNGSTMLPRLDELTAKKTPYLLYNLPVETLLPQLARHLKVGLVMGSPPYLDARTYGQDGIARDVFNWVEWMYQVTMMATAASKGLVVWVVAGTMRDHCYQPAPEGLIWRWFERGNHLWRPCIWRKNGLAGTGGEQKLRNDWEYILIFTKHRGRIPYANNLAMGKPPIYGAGGPMSYRNQDGSRVPRKKYKAPKLANPGNVIYAPVGGGRMGDDAAHKSVAPYPELLPEFFIKSYCKRGDIVCDPFVGSGTTGAKAVELGRRFIGGDIIAAEIRTSQKRIDARLAQMKATS